MKPTDINRLRSRIAALQAERDALGAAGPNRAERIARITEHCRQAAHDADARLAYFVAADDIGQALTQRANQAGVVDLGPLLAALLGPDVLAAALARHVPPDDGPDAATRAARLVAIDAELDRLEREEEAAIVRSEVAGTPIPRRAEARPEIVLEIVT